MPRNLPFWRNAIIIAVVHLVVLAGLLRWNGSAKTPELKNVVWLDASALAAAPAEAISDAASVAEPTPTPEPSLPPMEDPLTMQTPPPAEEATPAPTPEPTAKPRPTPQPTPKRAKTTKKEPRPTPEPTAKKTSAKTRTEAKPKPSAAPAASGESTGNSGSSGPSGGAGGIAEVGWYGDMLHDRFNRAWEQPTTIGGSAAKLRALIHLRIEQDGRVTEFRLARTSGNVVVDESIQAVGGRVTRVDPPPAALLKGGAYELNITFDWSGR